MTVSHAVSGAFIASALPNPLLYIPVALACHYAQDSIYHWDFGTGMTKAGTRSIKQTFILAALDALLGIALIALIWQQTPLDFNIHIWLGAFFCILPDLMEMPHLFFKKDFLLTRPLERWHDFIHRSTSNIFLGILPQIIIVLLICLIVKH